MNWFAEKISGVKSRPTLVEAQAQAVRECAELNGAQGWLDKHKISAEFEVFRGGLVSILKQAGRPVDEAAMGLCFQVGFTLGQNLAKNDNGISSTQED